MLGGFYIFLLDESKVSIRYVKTYGDYLSSVGGLYAALIRFMTIVYLFFAGPFHQLNLAAKFTVLKSKVNRFERSYDDWDDFGFITYFMFFLKT